ncbi:MAG: ABC transporter permease, partial [Actinomycetota bacterium]
MRLLATATVAVRDALLAARGQRVASVVSALVVAGATTAILATTGQTVATERRVLSQINSPAGRLVVLTDDENRAHVDATSVAAIATLDGVEWVMGLGQARDVTNAAVPAGTAVPARRVFGSWPTALEVAAYRSPADGDALVGPQAAQRLGLPEPIGGITATGLHAPVVGEFTAGEPLTDLNTSVLIHADATRGDQVRTIWFSVENVRDIDALTRAATAVLIAEDPSRLSARTNTNLAELQQVIGSQLAQTSRRLVWLALAAGMVLITVTQFGAVAQRARDYGRRRALGATRTGILVHVLLQVGLCAAVGALA